VSASQAAGPITDRAERIKVWVQHFKDRPFLVLQWIDPNTGKRKSKSTETADPGQAEEARGDLESDLNNGHYQAASRMTWERFRKAFEEEYVAPLRAGTRKVYANVLNQFERICSLKSLRSISERTVSAFAAGLRMGEDLARARIVIPADFGKSAKDQWVPLDPELRAALEALPRRGGWVVRFVTKRGRPIRQAAVSVRIMALAKKAGVRLSMHTLRKGFGCRYAGKVPAQVLQKLMRHADIKTTMDYYVNIDAAVEEAVLGPERNSQRNSPGQGVPDRGRRVAASEGSEEVNT
jgi:hypothetical protein